MENFDGKDAFVLGVIALLFLVLVPTTTCLVANITDLKLGEVATLISAYGSILLSSVLAYLYLQMWDTQEKQKSIQKNQERIMDRQANLQEKQHEMLQIEKRSLLDILGRETDKDDCHIQISNHGGGAIVELYIKTSLVDGQGQCSRIETSTQLMRAKSEISSGGRIIGAEEKSIGMRCCPQFEVEIDGEKTCGNFSRVATALSRNKIDRVEVRIDLVTADEYGNVAQERLLEEEVRIHNNMALEEVEAWKEN
ncbi:hypothetical protein [Halomarina pelagica]|uniref:hypothetical protein n=1 Tax=Halomarina pelagica TaxID=2961599 RepID=UPI0020C42CFF|nr:hypothetical protein [Halomarina sp. BND7]